MQRLSKGIRDKRLLRLINVCLKAGLRVMTSIVKFIEDKLKLKVNQTKSGVRRCSEVKFPGFTLLQEGGIRVADKTIARLKANVKKITRRNRGVRFEQVIEELNSALVGWTNYFNLANKWLSDFAKVNLLWFAQKGLLSLKLRMTV